MILDFESMQEISIPHFNNGEKETAACMYADALNRILRGRLVPGASIGLHTHTTGSEILYLLSGEGKLLYDGGEERIRAGQCHYCPKGHSHSLINDTDADLTFFAVVPQQ